MPLPCEVAIDVFEELHEELDKNDVDLIISVLHQKVDRKDFDLLLSVLDKKADKKDLASLSRSINYKIGDLEGNIEKINRRLDNMPDKNYLDKKLEPILIMLENHEKKLLSI